VTSPTRISDAACLTCLLPAGWPSWNDTATTRKLGRALGERKVGRSEQDRKPSQIAFWKPVSQALPLQDDEGGLLPFFIEWSKDSPHPSTDAPAGCRLERFELGAPQPAPLRARLSQLSLDAAVVSTKQASLRAVMVGPKGTLRLPA
jgi:hypothetical protein